MVCEWLEKGQGILNILTINFLIKILSTVDIWTKYQIFIIVIQKS